MRDALQGIIEGAITFYITRIVINTLITGTSMSENILTTIVPIAAAIGVVMVALNIQTRIQKP